MDTSADFGTAAAQFEQALNARLGAIIDDTDAIDGVAQGGGADGDVIPPSSSSSTSASAGAAADGRTMAQLLADRVTDMQARAGPASSSAARSSGPAAVPLAWSSGGSFSSAGSSSSTFGRERADAAARARAQGPAPTLAVATKSLAQAGAFKSIKPDGVARASASGMASMSIGALEALLARQKATLANARLLAALPDKGDLVRAKVAEVEQALRQAEAKQRKELEHVDQLMQAVRIDGGDEEKDEALAGPAAASSSSSASLRVATAASAAPFQGRGSLAVSQSCSSEQINARIAASTARNIESAFRRAPPLVISHEEALQLIRRKDAEWHAAITEGFAGGGFSTGFTANAGAQASPPARPFDDLAFRDQPMYDEDDDEEDQQRPHHSSDSEGEPDDVTSDMEAPE